MMQSAPFPHFLSDPVKVQHGEAGDLIVAYLRQLKVEYVFGVPGGAIEPMYNALARSEMRGGPRPVVARHECGAAFMAEGYARETGKLGVCIATSGPGATNLITGVASAFKERVPVLVITGQTALPVFGRDALQESSCTGVNITEMLRYCTRYSSLVSHIGQLERKLVTAVRSACHTPRGPAHLSLPLDIQRMNISDTTPSFDLESCVWQPEVVDVRAVDRLADRLSRSSQAAFFIGEGCDTRTTRLLMCLAERISASVVVAPQARGKIDPYHPLFKGVFGLGGHGSAYKALADPSVDLVVAVETSLNEVASRGWDATALMNSRLVHVDSDPANFSHSPMAELHVQGKAQTVFETLLARFGASQGLGDPQTDTSPQWERPSKAEVSPLALRVGVPKSGTGASNRLMNLVGRLTDEPAKCLSEQQPIKPQRLLYELARLFPAGTRFLADNGSSMLWATHYLFPEHKGGAEPSAIGAGALSVGMGFASMGWSVGSAVGVALGARDVPVVALVGDGAMLMSGQELTVAIAEGLTVVFVVLNDQCLGMVKHGQMLAGAERVGTSLPAVDFSMAARAMGANAYCVKSSKDLEELDPVLICGLSGPTVLDVHIDPNEVPPMKARMESLGPGERPC